MLAEVCRDCDDAQASAKLYQRVAGLDVVMMNCVGDAILGSRARTLGILAGTVGEADVAISHLRDAAALEHHAGARPWEAQTRLDLAAQLAAHDEDPADFGAELRRATELAEDLGTSGLLEASLRELTKSRSQLSVPRALFTQVPLPRERGFHLGRVALQSLGAGGGQSVPGPR